MVTHKVFLVDDEEIILKHMRSALEPDYQVVTSSTEREAMAIFAAEKPAVVILDLSLDPHHPADLGGMRLLEYILREEPSTRAIVVTGNDDDQNALRAVRLGAFDYYAKPVRLEELRVMIKRACHIHELHRRAHQNAQASVLQPSDVGVASAPNPTDVNLKFAKKAIEMDFVRKALRRNGGIISRAARELGISRVNLYELMDRYNIRIQEFKMIKAGVQSPIRTKEIS